MSVNSGLFIDPKDCDYCRAWPSTPCAFHRERDHAPTPSESPRVQGESESRDE